ncbi:hypothetical protein SAMN02745194_03686 [Roseomonas rosea]|uniref:Uncharacterized protein n=1 Tax=Muricoccus roseus TaxID=198092 RepID=A0A1M6N3G1_9PROT|nr:hypothetical protein [Roseomonas rosea]SHJ90113.1 hypothetical protein SAMN02745194_03686 [Roseomonas rosea]
MAANLFFWRQEEQIGNFGDALAVLYIERLFGERCLFDMGSLHLVGSVITPNRLRQAKRHGHKPNDW